MRYIYLLKDPTNNKIVYVGETINIKRRFDTHRYGTNDDSKDKKEWLKSLKLKKLTPIIEIIDFADSKQEAFGKENFYISKYLKEGYKLFNIRNTKTLKQFDLKGNLIAEFENCVIAKIKTGIMPKVDRYTTRGFYWSYDNDIKDRILKKEKGLKSQCKVVLQLDKENNIIAEFEGVRIACQITGIDHRSISQVASGSKIRKTAGGYKWKYK
jgi:predicted GIY-YIG superfamily endonuclease